MSDLAALTAGTWNVDPSHSEVGFTVRHLMISKVRGSFSQFTGSVEVGADPLQSKLSAEVQIASITTKDENRDGHLRSADFFEVEKYPTMTFATTGITAKGSNYALAGDLTIKGTTKPVVFELEFNGVGNDPWGNTRAGFAASTEISREEYGLTWNAALETGGVVVGDKVKIELEVELVKAA